MKVYKFNQWSREEDDYHAIQKSEWSKGQYKLIALFLDTYCGKKYSLQPRDKYQTYNKKEHRSKMCQDCVKVMQRIINSRKKGV